MKPLPIPESVQIDAMLHGTIFDVLAEYVNAPRVGDLGKYITVDRAELISYLDAHPEAAKAYFQREQSSTTTHDVERILRCGSDYTVVSMFHGEEQSPRHFNTLAEAVAEHVLLGHLMY
jgi:hypothetical protein